MRQTPFQEKGRNRGQAPIEFYYNIPLQNIVLRILYAATLLYKRFGDRIPSADEPTNYAHDETRDCLFDMNASKLDVIHSCHRPRICDFCVGELRKAQVSNEVIQEAQREIKGIAKPLFYRIGDFIKQHPIWSAAISVFVALVIGILGSVIGTYIYAFLDGRT